MNSISPLVIIKRDVQILLYFSWNPAWKDTLIFLIVPRTNPSVHFSMIIIHYPVLQGKSITFPHIYKDLHRVPLISRALSVPVENTGGKTAFHSHMSSHTTRDYPVRERTISIVFLTKNLVFDNLSLFPRIGFSLFLAINIAHRGHQLEVYV